MRNTGLLALAAAAVFAIANVAQADIPNHKVTVGVLTDLSGPYEGNGGHGSVEAAKMAAEDFAKLNNDFTVYVVSADHQNKPDLGASIANHWFDVDHVDVITDLINSGVGFAVLNIAKSKNKMLLLTSAGSADFTGKACAPDNSVQWTYDTYAAGSAAGEALPELGKTWFFITADYVFGKGVQEGTTRAIEARGGKVVGSVLVPIGTQDFSSFILQAQASKAEVIALANGGQDTLNAIKAAREFGVMDKGQKVFPGGDLVMVKTLGLQDGQGLEYTTYWYPGLNEKSEAFYRAFIKRRGTVPSDFQVGTYSAVYNYLLAVKATNSVDPKTVIAKMRETTVNDAFTNHGVLRPDGRMVHDVYLLQIKTPAESKDEYDLVKVAATIPGDKAFRPIDAPGGCPQFAKP